MPPGREDNMRYTVKMSDTVNGKEIVITIEAKSVFDAIDIAANLVGSPEDMKFEACPATE